jgi:hypothetical protein
MHSMKFDCDDCKVDNNIKTLVEGSYLDLLEAEKAKIDDVNLVSYTVTKYR